MDYRPCSLLFFVVFVFFLKLAFSRVIKKTNSAQFHVTIFQWWKSARKLKSVIVHFVSNVTSSLWNISKSEIVRGVRLCLCHVIQLLVALLLFRLHMKQIISPRQQNSLKLDLIISVLATSSDDVVEQSHCNLKSSFCFLVLRLSCCFAVCCAFPLKILLRQLKCL